MKFKMWMVVHLIFLFITVIFSAEPTYLLMLTVAQLVFVPMMVVGLMKKSDWLAKVYPFIQLPASISVVLLQVTAETSWDLLLSAIYLLFTITIALFGFTRSLKRGFSKIEEFMIDIGFMYVAIGGMWFFASIAGIDTGFSPMITWLTAIHFHYSSFLLPIFTGLLGRVYQSANYKYICTLIIISPILVALGITFSVWLEFLSVLTYIVAIYRLIYLSFQLKFEQSFQKWCIRISFLAIGITILLSLLYAFGNVTNLYTITIPYMLQFHGVMNCILFGLIGVVGWIISIPKEKRRPKFPISQIRGKAQIGEPFINQFVDEGRNVRGLVDDMTIYIDSKMIAPTVKDFYENTVNYRLYSRVLWHHWFKPFAFMYQKMISSHVRQLNLPIHSGKVEMTGEVLAIQELVDGRRNPRAWIRKVEEKEVFVALYSFHESNDKTYMNIALPLPFSSMVGILEVFQVENKTILTSKGKSNSDAGIYLAVRNCYPKLPISEKFIVEEKESGVLIATHTMKIFSIPFLTINYEILHHKMLNKKENNTFQTI